jgi:shikimate kinase
MEKITVIGSAGAGKTFLARKLGSKFHMKIVHLDRLFWERDWKGKTKDTRIDILEKLVQEKQWIIEGTYISSSEPRLYAADTIIFLDTAPLVCLLRIIRRHHPLLCLLHKIRGHQKYHWSSRRDIPEGCIDKLTLFRIFKVLVFPFQERRTLEQKLHYYNTKQIIRLRSNKEVEVFLAQLLQDVNDQRDLFHEQTHLQVTEFATT